MGKTALEILYYIFTNQIIITSCGLWEFSTCNENNAKQWTPSWPAERDDLYCLNVCEGAEENCCSCNLCTTWQGKEIRLNIEDISLTGQNIVLSNNQSSSHDVYKIERRYSKMKMFPVNLCKNVNDTQLSDIFISISNISEHRNSIVRINLEYNEIEEIADINCLYKLDELNLRYNRISFLSNTSFENLYNLRILNLEDNRLTKLDPNTFSSANLHLLYANINKNNLQSLDVSNIVPSFPFCEYSFESNIITEFVNEDNFALDTGKNYGPGFLNLQGNSIKKFPDLKNLLNINDLNILGKVWDFGFDLRGIPITCDCSLQPFLSLSKDLIEVIWRDYFDVKCTAPEHLNGVSIPDLNLSELVCPLDADSGCQSPQCTCVDKPNTDTLLIDCSNAVPRLRHFPSIPDSKYSSHISLNLSGNMIKYIPDEPFLSKLSVLDLSNNDIREINDSIAGRLEATVLDLRNNDRFLRLPQTFQYRNACSIVIDNIIVDCDCDSQWVAEWLQLKACKSGLFYCNVPGKGIMPANFFNTDDLECSTISILYVVISVVLGSVIALIIASGCILHKFRYEAIIIYLRIRKKREKENCMTSPNVLYDVYITLDENNENIVAWVNNHLHDVLKDLGYSVFLPYKDIPFGSVRADEAAHAIERSRAVLVILSNDHFHLDDNEHQLTDYEWNYAWSHYRNGRCNIILINFDYISSSDINHPQVKAFLRVGSCIDFRNHDRDIMDKIRERLGEAKVKLGEAHACKHEPKIEEVTLCKMKNERFERKSSCTSLTVVDIAL